MSPSPGTPPTTTRLTTWIGGISLAVALAMVPLLVVQYRQYQLLSRDSLSTDDSGMWQSYQVERVHGRLFDALAEAASAMQEGAGVDLPALTGQRAALGQRMAPLRQGDSAAALRATPQYQRAIGLLENFDAQMGRVLQDLARGQGSPADLRNLMALCRQQEPALAALTEAANQLAARSHETRHATIRRQGLLVIGLAGVQIIALVAFLGLLVVHLRRQHRQNVELTELTDGLRAARAEAEAANQGKSHFLANMSHEIRTPFQGLLGMLTLLDESGLSDRQRDYLHTARDSAQHLLGILNDILDVSTMESGTLKLAVRPVRVEDIVNEVQSLMEVAALDKGLDLMVRIEPGTPEWVNADATRVRQILFNLVSNAIKFTARGLISVRLYAPTEYPGVEIEVRDTGPGMDAQTLRNLFSRFYQAEAGPTRRHGGTGLGLEISRNLARMMGGDITVESEIGQGSRFVVKLPLETVTGPQPQTAPMPLTNTRLRVLAAEDHPINLKYMSILLEKMGHDAIFCENGQEALELVRTRPFDVVLMDLHMPVMDGLAATRAIRALKPPAGNVKIVLVTADVVNDTREKALAAGVDAFSTKPLQIEDLRRALARCGLLADTEVLDESTGPGTDFPMSQYDVPPVDARAIVDDKPMDWIDGPALREVLAMMPEQTLNELLFEMFFTPGGAVKALLAALEGNDRQAIGQAAHKLKGTCMLLGLKALVKSTAELEHIAKRTEQPIDSRTVVRMELEVRETLRVLETLGVTITLPDSGLAALRARS